MMINKPPFSDGPMEEGGVIFWDAIGLIRPQTGIFRHAASLYPELQRLHRQPRLLWPKGVSCAFSRAERLEVPSLGLSSQIERLKLVWPRLASLHLLKRHRGARGIIHGLSNFNLSWSADLSKNWRRVLTIHDLIPLLAPDDVSVALAFQMRHALKRLSTCVDQVVCISEWTKSTLAEQFPSLAARAVVIPNGFEPAAFFPERVAGPRINGLVVSRWETYKRLIDVLSILGAMPELDVTVVTDQTGKRWFHQHGTSYLATGRLRVMTQVPDPELKTLYAKAHVLIHPSLFEGFCLPIAEALACGLPVVYRRGHGADEVAGDCGGFAVERDAATSDWGAAILRAAQAAGAPDFRASLRQSLEQKPTWATAARRIADLYDTLLKSQS